MKAIQFLVLILFLAPALKINSQTYLVNDEVYKVEYAMNLYNQDVDYSIAEVIIRKSKNEIILIGNDGRNIMHEIYSEKKGNGYDAVLTKYKAMNGVSDCGISVLEQDDFPYRAITYHTENEGHTNIALAFKIYKVINVTAEWLQKEEQKRMAKRKEQEMIRELQREIQTKTFDLKEFPEKENRLLYSISKEVKYKLTYNMPSFSSIEEKQDKKYVLRNSYILNVENSSYNKNGTITFLHGTDSTFQLNHIKIFIPTFSIHNYTVSYYYKDTFHVNFTKGVTKIKVNGDTVKFLKNEPSTELQNEIIKRLRATNGLYLLYYEYGNFLGAEIYEARLEKKGNSVGETLYLLAGVAVVVILGLLIPSE